MIPTFIIFLREGLEGSMIVAILLSYLAKIGQRRHFRDVYLGVAAAAVVMLGGGVAAYVCVAQYDGSNVQTYFETATYLVATVALTYMTFWMQRHARSLSGDLQRRSDAALTGTTRTGLGALAFQAVGREGLETTVFTLAIIFASSKKGATPVHGNLLLVGAVLGLASALVIAYCVYRLGAKLNLRRFFQVLGVLLMLFAAGILADAIQNAQELGWLPFGRGVLWDSSKVIAEQTNFGDVLHAMLGYADHPTVLQFAVWAGYLMIAATVFIRRGRLPKKVAARAA